MPTINQLVRRGRKQSEFKSKSPALGRGYNALEKRPTKTNSPSFVIANVVVKIYPFNLSDNSFVNFIAFSANSTLNEPQPHDGLIKELLSIKFSSIPLLVK